MSCWLCSEPVAQKKGNKSILHRVFSSSLQTLESRRDNDETNCELPTVKSKARVVIGTFFAVSAATSAACQETWATGDASRGRSIYQGCEDCHSLDKNE
jgi:hypothetical protein